MTKSKFEVIVETVIRKKYVVEAKDADFAKIKALGAQYYEGEVLSKERVATSVKQTTPRYVYKQNANNQYLVTDTKLNEVVAKVHYLDVVEAVVAAMNAEEDAQ